MGATEQRRPMPGRILVVDDDPNICEVLSRVLNDEGHLVRTAEDGAKALKLARQFQFDVCFLDYKLPGRSGVDLLPELQTARPDMAVVMISAFGKVLDGFAAGRLGAVEWLKKPFGIEPACALVRKLLGARAKAQEDEVISAVRARFGVSDVDRLPRTARHVLLAAEASYATQGITLSDLMPQELHNEPYVSTAFKQAVGVPFSSYLLALRMEKADRLRARGHVPANNVPRLVGYSTYGAFARACRRRRGQPRRTLPQPA